MDILKFEHIEYLWALMLIPILIGVWLVVMYRIKKKLIGFGDPDLVNQLRPHSSPLRRNIKFSFLMLALTAIIFALANPQLGSKLETVKRKGVDLVIAIDVSNSMLAEDIRPNRLKSSQMAITKLIDELQGDRIGLVVFAGSAYTQLPITTDYAAARMFLSTLNTDYVKAQGTSIASAIELGRKSFKQKDEDNAADKKNKAIIVITDGEDHEEGAVKEAELAAEEGIIIYTIGMGKERGAPIPVYKHGVRTAYKKDKKGNTIITRLNENSLREIAEAGEGKYVRANNSKSGLKEIFDEINALDKVEIEAQVFKNYESRFQLPVSIAFVFLILELMLVEMRSNWKIMQSLNQNKDV